MRRRSFFKGLVGAAAGIVVAPATVLDDLAEAQHMHDFFATGRVSIDMGRHSALCSHVPDSTIVTEGPCQQWRIVREDDPIRDPYSIILRYAFAG